MIVRDLLWSPDGAHVLTCADDGVLLWNPQSGKLIRRIAEGNVSAIGCLPNGRVVTGGKDGKLRIWNVRDGLPLYELDGHKAEILVLCVVPGGRRVVTSSEDHSLRIWDLKTGRCEYALPQRRVKSLAVDARGRWIACSHQYENVIQLWDLAGRRILWSADLEDRGCVSLEWNPDGSELVTMRERGEKALEIRNPKSGKVRKQFDAADARPTDIAIATAGTEVLVAYDGHRMELRSLADGTRLASFDAKNVSRLAATADGTRAVSVTVHRTLALWQLDRP